MSAIPIELPSCSPVLNTPEAEPASCRGTRASTMSASGAITAPSPRPAATRLGTSSQVVTAAPQWLVVAISPAIPAAMTSAPAMVTPRPKRGASRAAAAEETSTPSEKGRKVSPACSGVKPRPSCRNRVRTRP
jgi:hypothetical protein